MALLFINEIDKGVRLGVWEMEENLNYEKFASLPFYDRLMSLSPIFSLAIVLNRIAI